MRLPAFLQPRVLRQAVRSLFSRPFTTEFPAGGFEPVDAFRGRPRFDADHCIGCGACAEVCPPKCIDVVDDLEASPPVRRFVQHVDACIWCGQCARHCPTQAGIVMSHEYDAAGFVPADFEERVEKTLALCERCGTAVAPLDQLRFLADRLGPVAYANPTLLVTIGRDLDLAARPVTSDGVQRADRLSIQCARCRRKTAFAV